MPFIDYFPRILARSSWHQSKILWRTITEVHKAIFILSQSAAQMQNSAELTMITV